MTPIWRQLTHCRAISSTWFTLLGDRSGSLGRACAQQATCRQMWERQADRKTESPFFGPTGSHSRTMGNPFRILVLSVIITPFHSGSNDAKIHVPCPTAIPGNIGLERTQPPSTWTFASALVVEFLHQAINHQAIKQPSPCSNKSPRFFCKPRGVSSTWKLL